MAAAYAACLLSLAVAWEPSTADEVARAAWSLKQVYANRGQCSGQPSINQIDNFYDVIVFFYMISFMLR